MDIQSHGARVHSARNTTRQEAAPKTSDWVSHSLLTEENLDRFSQGPSWGFMPTLGGIDLVTNRPGDRVEDRVLREINIANQAFTEVVNDLRLDGDIDEATRLGIITEALNKSLLNHFTTKDYETPANSAALRSFIITKRSVWDTLLRDEGCSPIRMGGAWTIRGLAVEDQLRSHLNPTQEETRDGVGPLVAIEVDGQGSDPATSEP
jgi:hypothetical protein